MKKLSVIFFLSFVVVSVVSAQDYKKFKVLLAPGYALPGGDNATGGVLFTLEPAYRIKDNLSVGLRMETAVVIAGGLAAAPGASVSASALVSYTLNGQYYFGKGDSKFRPFAGAGFGMFTVASATITVVGAVAGIPPVVTPAETKFGFYPRVGFDLGHFSMSIDYNLVPATGTVTNNYLGIRLGAFFGGGKK